MNSLVKMLNISEISALTHKFIAIDKDSTGMISVEELSEVLVHSNHPMTAERINKIVDEVDCSNNHKIKYSEFIAATI